MSTASKKRKPKSKALTKQSDSNAIEKYTDAADVEKVLKLNPQQVKFAHLYFCTGNRLRSAVRAGYSEKAAPQIAWRLLNSSNIAAYINFLRKQESDRLKVTRESITNELASVARSNIQHFVNEDGSMKNLTDIPSSQAAAVESIQVQEVFVPGGEDSDDKIIRTTKFKTHSKLGALDQLNKMLGNYEKDNAQRGNNVNVQVNVIKLIDGSEISI